jgi:hypothetical protein
MRAGGTWVVAVVAVGALGGACRRGPVAAKFEASHEIREADLPAEERSALQCGRELARKENLLEHDAIAVAVSKGPAVKGTPPDWKSGDEWTVRFEIRGLGPNSRDGGFRIVLRPNPCRALQIMVPG